MFEIRFAGDDELMKLIEFMRSHLSHKFPKGNNFLEIFKFAMNYVKDREDLARQKPSTRKTSTGSDSRHIPTRIKQRVWKRDHGRCVFVGSNGKRCNSDYLLQFDHYPVPFARGGKSTADNLRLLCAKHNRHTAEKAYGRAHMKEFYLKEPSPGYCACPTGGRQEPRGSSAGGYGSRGSNTTLPASTGIGGSVLLTGALAGWAILPADTGARKSELPAGAVVEHDQRAEAAGVAASGAV